MSEASETAPMYSAVAALRQDAPQSPEAARFVERLVRLHEDKAAVAEQIKDVKGDAKDAGFDPAALMLVVKRRLETASKRTRREEIEAEAEQIMAALGLLADLPLGQAARERATS